jgi:hypothetical protein
MSPEALANATAKADGNASAGMAEESELYGAESFAGWRGWFSCSRREATLRGSANG